MCDYNLHEKTPLLEKVSDLMGRQSSNSHQDVTVDYDQTFQGSFVESESFVPKVQAGFLRQLVCALSTHRVLSPFS